MVTLNSDVGRLWDSFYFGLKPHDTTMHDDHMHYDPENTTTVTLVYELHSMPCKAVQGPWCAWPRVWKRFGPRRLSLVNALGNGHMVYLKVSKKDMSKMRLTLKIRWVITQMVAIAGGVDVVASLRDVP